MEPDSEIFPYSAAFDGSFLKDCSPEPALETGEFTPACDSSGSGYDSTDSERLLARLDALSGDSQQQGYGGGSELLGLIDDGGSSSSIPVDIGEALKLPEMTGPFLSPRQAAGDFRCQPREAAREMSVIRATPDSASMGREAAASRRVLNERSRKNAENARVNRLKKKRYVENLQKVVSSLSEENASLKAEKSSMASAKKSLEEEVKYLRNVLMNQSTLSDLLKNIENVGQVKLTSHFAKAKRKAAAKSRGHNDHNYEMEWRQPAPVGGGVCLHVEKEQVSLEFCEKCAKMACSDS